MCFTVSRHSRYWGVFNGEERAMMLQRVGRFSLNHRFLHHGPLSICPCPTSVLRCFDDPFGVDSEAVCRTLLGAKAVAQAFGVNGQSSFWHTSRHRPIASPLSKYWEEAKFQVGLDRG